MARIPKPTAAQQQSGAFQHDPARGRARQDEPVPTGPLGDAPAYFAPDEAAVWRELAAQAPDGVLTCADRFILEITARMLAAFRRNEPLTAADRNQIISGLARMGLTPADRTRLKVPPKANKFAKFNVQ